MNNLEMLTAREQLMEDISCYVEEMRYSDLSTDEFINWICDCVCRNFPISK